MRPFLLITLFCAAIVVAACHKSNNNTTHPAAGDWRWVEEDWHIGANGSGVITPKPDSLTILSLNKDMRYTVSVSGTSRSGTYQNDTTQIQITGGILVDSFLVFNTPPQLSSGVIVPEKARYHIGNDSLYLQSMLTPGGYWTDIFVAVH